MCPLVRSHKSPAAITVLRFGALSVLRARYNPLHPGRNFPGPRIHSVREGEMFALIVLTVNGSTWRYTEMTRVRENVRICRLSRKRRRRRDITNGTRIPRICRSNIVYLTQYPPPALHNQASLRLEGTAAGSRFCRS